MKSKFLLIFALSLAIISCKKKDKIDESFLSSMEEITDIIDVEDDKTLQEKLDSIKESLKDYEEEIKEEKKIPEGALRGLFSVSPTKKVYFSQGNLQYCPATKKFRFAEKQYDVCAENNDNALNDEYDGWIDLFCWGTSGYNDKKPNSFTTSHYFYPNSENDSITGTEYDWGVFNPIENGGLQAGLWRTPTQNEFDYLLKLRPNAAALAGIIQINGLSGGMLLPDNFKLPDVFDFEIKWFNQMNLTLDQWAVLEQLGAVFLPKAGQVYSGINNNETYCKFSALNKTSSYWSSTGRNTPEGSDKNITAFCIKLSDTSRKIEEFYEDKRNGNAVRLVQDFKEN